MSVVSYKDGVLASDSRLMSDVILSDKTRKIFENQGMLLGVSGEWDKCVKGISWFKDGADLSDIPEEDFQGLLVIPTFPKEKIYLIGFGYALEIDEPFFSIGSGSSVALGAMYAGASAPGSVLAAIKFQNGCGGEVQKLYLKRRESND